MSPSPNIVLLAGTDTGVGKTWTGCALARALRATGTRVVALKAIETGRIEPSTREDGALLAAATGQAAPRRALLRYRESLAPAIAAEREGPPIDPAALTAEIQRYALGAEVTLVETAGGLLAPITWSWNALNLAEAIGARALLVASDRLGTINLTLLSLCALEAADIPILGVVLTAPATTDESTGTNAAAIARLSELDRVIELPRTHDPEAAMRSVREVCGWISRPHSAYPAPPTLHAQPPGPPAG